MSDRAPPPRDPVSRPVSRRRLLQAGVGTSGLFTLAASGVLARAPRGAPSDRPRLAGVGVGGVGFGQVEACEKAGFEVACLCDVDHEYAKKAFDRWPGARKYVDFREMLQAEGDRIDAVYVGTPDHTHAIIVLEALRRKKHVLCVKPLTRTIEECRVVVGSAARAGVATQVTTSPNTGEDGCRATELIAAGAIGPVREVHVWSDRPVWPQGMRRPSGEDAVPASLDWKLWLGPAPLRPWQARWPEGDPALAEVNIQGGGPSWYSSVYHPFNFRGWWDFGTGALGDMGCHYLNIPFRALALGSPTHIEATSTKLFPEAAPLASIVSFEFPARAAFPPVRVVWYDGGLKPPAPRGFDAKTLPGEGVFYLGDEGSMFGARILSEERARKFESVPRTLERRAGTWAEWLEAVRGGPAAGCDFAWSGPLTECVLLGNIAIRTGRRLRWDAEAGRFPEDVGASAFVAEAYQNGWKLQPV